MGLFFDFFSGQSFSMKSVMAGLAPAISFWWNSSGLAPHFGP
jgi:hypothetical protein